MLSTFLTAEIFSFLLIFCRLGSAFMLLPGFGEAYVLARSRLMLALAFSIVLVPVITLPPLPDTPIGLFTLMLGEILIGLFIGALCRMLIAAMHVAGTIIAYQSSLISALVPDISQQGQGTALGNFLGVSAVVLLFATDLHHLIIRALVDSYGLFLPGHFPAVADFAEHMSKVSNGAFRMAMQLAAPHVVIGIMLYLGSGVIARLMPNIQIFFIMMPPQILLSMCVLMIAINAILIWYMNYFQDNMSIFLAP